MEVFRVGISPHIRKDNSVSGMMLDVCVALLPSLVWGVYVFGLRALVIILLSVFCCLGFEALWQLLMKKSFTLSNLSALVSGLLLAMMLPVSVPLWIVPAGALVAMVGVKGLFGGLGKNIVNPVVTAKAVLFVLFPALLTRYTLPFVSLPAWKIALPDGLLAPLSAPSTLDALSEPASAEELSALIAGGTPGSIGEGSALLLLAGFLYLLVRGTVTWHIPLTYLATVAAGAFLLPHSGNVFLFVLRYLLSGGVIFAAVFLATDPVTGPVTRGGKLIYGVLCGALTVLARRISGGEGVLFAILLANLSVRFLDRVLRPRPYGTKRFRLRKDVVPFPVVWYEKIKKLFAKPDEKASENKLVARILCAGGDKAKEKCSFDGVMDCRVSQTLSGGTKLCSGGCVGLGNCVRACPYGAIAIREGVAVVEPDKCRGCGACSDACPKNLIVLLPADAPFTVLCHSADKGAETIRTCEVGCINCKKCEKSCEAGAIDTSAGFAVINADLCTGCGACTEVCPRGIIRKAN